MQHWKKPISLLILLFLTQVLLAQKDLPISAHFQNLTLKEVFTQLEKDYSISFSYSDDLLEDYTVTQKFENEELDAVLAKILAKTDLDYRFVENNYILIIPQKEKNLPFEDSFIAAPKEERQFSGIIKDKAIRQALPFANIYVVGTTYGANSQDDGSFSFTAMVGQKDTLEVSYVGYLSQRIAIADIEGEQLEIVLALDEVAFEGVVVTEYLTDGINLGTEVGELSLNPNRIGTIPGQVEPDILQSIQLLPGVTSPNESAAGLNIRGGTADQNLVLWDGIPMYHLGHFFGSISAFNPYIVDEVKVWRGGFGANYGGRASGVIDIHSIQNIPEKIGGGVGLNLMHGHAFLEIPIIKNKLAVILAGRRSFTDIIPTTTFRRLQDKVFQGTKVEDNGNEVEDNNLIVLTDIFFYNDFNAKLLWQPSRKDKVSFSGTRTLNDFLYEFDEPVETYVATDDLQLVSSGYSVDWEHSWTKEFFSNLKGTYSAFEYVYHYDENGEDFFETADKSNEVLDQRIQLNNVWDIHPQHRLRNGYHLTNYQTSYLIDYNAEEEVFNFQDDKSQTIHATYFDYLYRDKKDKLHIQAGLRLNYHSSELQWWEPRFTAKYKVLPLVQMKFSADWNHQYIHQLIEIGFNSLGVQNQIWILADQEEVPVVQGRQFTLGFSFQKNGWMIDVEAYRKRLLGITSLTPSFISLNDDFLSEGRGDISGIDFLVKKRWKNYRTWVSYTWSRSDYRFDEILDTSFPAFNDQRQVLSWVNLWKVAPFDISLGWNFNTGKPYTPLIDTEVIFPTDFEEEYIQEAIPILGDVNAARLPNYHRLDFSVLYNFPKASNRKWKGEVGISVANIYNHYNIQSRTFDNREYFDEDELEDEVYTIEKQLIRFSPNILIKMKW